MLMENRLGIVVDTRVTPADGYAECDATLLMVANLAVGCLALGGDKGYDYRMSWANCEHMPVTAHVGQNTTNRRSPVDARTTRRPGPPSTNERGSASRKSSAG